MKLTEKILRCSLPDQLKALLEKFDGDFDASHLRALKNLADEETFTWYERHMLKRAHKMARVKLERDRALDTAMSVVLNLKEEDLHAMWYSNPAQQSTNPYLAVSGATISSAFQTHLDKQALSIKRNIERQMMGMPR
jgi:hypothetical protein